jgi:2-polyprenyl-6-methoxyphenol hydroxylase-like FAD-dependent oxidoreductase
VSYYLAEQGVTVDRETRLVGFTQGASYVEAEIRRKDGTSETKQFGFVVGCDGAHSVVRKTLGFTFTGKSYDERFLLADVVIEAGLDPTRVNAFFSEDGLVAIFPMPGGRFRIVATCLPDEAAENVETPTLEEVTRIVRGRTGIEAVLRDPIWLARFRIHCRQVEHYRDKRVFLAGDAAHIHSPAGGQGMNQGLQDAHNLAWKLALVVRGHAPATLLDSYEAERHGVGAAVLAGTDIATRVATLRNPIARNARDHLARFMSSLEVVQQRIAREVSELTVSYERSSIVAEDVISVLGTRLGRDGDEEAPTVAAARAFALAPRAGSRAPDAFCVRDGVETRLATIIDGRVHTLLLFDGRAHTDAGYAKLARIATEVRARLGALVNVHIVLPTEARPASLDFDGSVLWDRDGDLEARYGAIAECAYLVRPDLYVAYRALPLDEAKLWAFLGKNFFAAVSH